MMTQNFKKYNRSLIFNLSFIYSVMLTIPPLLRDNMRGESIKVLPTDYFVFEVLGFHILFFLLSLFFCYFNYYWRKTLIPKLSNRYVDGFLVFFVNIVIAIIISFVLSKLLYWIFDFQPLDRKYGFMFARVLFTSLFSLLIAYILELINRTKISEVENAKLKEEVMASQLASLKEQINPHFLFNTLNSLSSVIRLSEKEKSLEFVDRLSQVYRYILESNEKDLVKIPKELEFLYSYIFLLKSRFNDKLIVNIDQNLYTLNACIPPLALQLLIENAVQHNIITKESQLIIEVELLNNEIVVHNNLQKKNSSESFGIGLPNLSKRYKLLAGKNIDIKETKDSFIVKLPIIEYEGTDY